MIFSIKSQFGVLGTIVILSDVPCNGGDVLLLRVARAASVVRKGEMSQIATDENEAARRPVQRFRSLARSMAGRG